MLSGPFAWLPADADWRTRLRRLRTAPPDPSALWTEAVSIANTRLEFAAVNMLDAVLRERLAGAPPPGLATRPVRLAVLASCTTSHLLPALRAAGVRHGLWIDTYECNYGQYRQELLDTGSGLHRFAPTAVLFAIDARHLTAAFNAAWSEQDADAAVDAALGDLAALWRLARERFGCQLIQQLPVNPYPALMGGNEDRLPGSQRSATARLMTGLRALAAREAVDVIGMDDQLARWGLDFWHDPGMWHRAKQEITVKAAPLYGELAVRLLAAKQGRSFKCLVLDLDNTLWGGVIGDDGIDGIVLGQASPLGEAFLELQAYALELARRGIILAVCSKNDAHNALEVFEKHPDMLLRRGDIASFVANWQDKPANLQAIAHVLSIGLDAMVFVDDNPVERDLVRRTLPMVAVPELPEDAAWVPRCLADAGYFESLAITAEDRARAVQYQDNIARESLRASATDLPAYLRGLEMRLIWSEFDAAGLARIVQLINKTNQFNLTTRRHDEAAVTEVMRDPRCLGLQFRLRDRFGDNGIIAIVIARPARDRDDGLQIDTWLMSCRVLGREVERATLDVVAAQARARGARRLLGEYRPTEKNGMVREHYTRLGFAPQTLDDAQGLGDPRMFQLELDGYVERNRFITIQTAREAGS